MSVALHRYQQLRDAPDDNSRAKAIADAFKQVEGVRLKVKLECKACLARDVQARQALHSQRNFKRCLTSLHHF